MKKMQRVFITAMACTMLATAAFAQNFEVEPIVGFPDFGYMAPPGTGEGQYTGPVFVLADQYPKTLPALDRGAQKILKMDFKADAINYAVAVRDYIFEGNIRGGDVERDFDLHLNSVDRQWYHAPWQHWGQLGREGYHGLTREGPLSPLVLDSTQSNSSYAYAVGFYNGPGGFTLGKVWPSADQGPNLSSLIAGEGFPEGTIVGKFLFTVLDESQVSYLKNPLQWNAYMYNCDVPSSPSYDKCSTDKTRSTQKVSLLQMDIMVKDSRAVDAAGWVFGTFVYNGNLPSKNDYSAACEQYSGEGKKWCNLVPVGVMWGNDPDNDIGHLNLAPSADHPTVINKNLKQTVINPSKDLPAQHLGWASRLDGPADNPGSSCMSCHSTGQYPAVSPIMMTFIPAQMPQDGTKASDKWMRYFSNFKDGEAFDEGRAVSTDFSMQLLKSIQNYVEWRSQSQDGIYAIEYWTGDNVNPVTRGPVVK